MKLYCALLAVKDVETSKRFCHDLLGQEVVLDLGWNVTLFKNIGETAELIAHPTNM